MTSDTRPSTLDRLDVPTLARALAAAEIGCLSWGGFHDGNADETVTHVRDARKLAAEYSRLLEEDRVAPESESEKREAFGK